MSREVDIAEEVLAALNAAGLGFVARREYQPPVDKPAQPSYDVIIQPESLAEEGVLDRCRKTEETIAMMVDVFRTITATDAGYNRAEIDAALDVCESIRDTLRRDKTVSAPWLAASQTPLYDPEELRENQVFHSSIVVRYREIRS